MKKYRLKIGTPCNESWEKMTGGELERFCSRCSKSVTDFTGMTDQQIIKMITDERSKNICGKLSNNQLNRVYRRPDNKLSSSAFSKVLPGLLLLGATNELNAQETKTTDQEVVQSVYNHLKESKTDTSKIESDKPSQDTSKYIIEGKIIDSETQEPVGFANIWVKDTDIRNSSDIDGQYKIMIPDSIITDQITIRLAFVGYAPKSITLQASDFPLTSALTIKMTAQVQLLGEVEIIEKKPWWKFWK
ncbi:carboxypeptidase-like regulatory domain-containing protein [Salibacter halophilus]|uniref:Carboxypeptidase-like regulatory domain-containing protein n=1 Tax=Salibacter halophilus TaxID=1803916 RepID=A0A6N6M6N6_9FLAO|nr:carboxypeptidase-like regulatory domain-containing protein [Salibacter halophilus]KAB1065574.1 carboxypeptidase-like regulatory domain-containing protein [Salibacter halophilus]